MCDPSLMRGFKRIQNLCRVLDGAFHRNGSLKRGALRKLQNQIIRANVMKLTNIRMIQSCRCAGFSLKSVSELHLGELKSHGSAEPRIARAIHFSHASSSDKRNDLVGAEFLARRKSHNLT